MSYTITLNDLVNNSNVVAVKESSDKDAARLFLNPSRDGVLKPLHQWISSGYIENYPIHTLQLAIPSTCSDSVQRNFPEYFTFLTNYSYEQIESTMTVKLSTFNLTYLSTISSFSVCVNPN
jgi:hypothetical protein